MSTYLMIDLLIIVCPLILITLPWFSYYRRSFRQLIIATVTVGALFVVWDGLVTRRGDWGFNPQFVLPFSLAGLPIEEWLFFLAVPFSCLFIYESLRHFFTDRPVPFNRRAYRWTALLCFFLALLSLHHGYSALVFLATGLWLIWAADFARKMLSSLFYWVYLGLSFLLFVVFNYYLTSFPVVIYNPSAILGVRVLTIPVEDFFYNLILLSLYLAVYLLAEKKESKIKP